MLFILRFFPSLSGSSPILPCRGGRPAKKAALCPSDHSAGHFRSSPAEAQDPQKRGSLPIRSLCGSFPIIPCRGAKPAKNEALCPSDHSEGHFRSSPVEAQDPQKRGSLPIRSLCRSFPILSCRGARPAKTRLSAQRVLTSPRAFSAFSYKPPPEVLPTLSSTLSCLLSLQADLLGRFSDGLFRQTLLPASILRICVSLPHPCGGFALSKQIFRMLYNCSACAVFSTFRSATLRR